MLIQAFQSGFLGLHIKGVIQLIVNTELFVDLSRSVAIISCELGRAVIVQLDEMLLFDGVIWHPHIVSYYLRLFLQVLPLDAPTNSTWHSCDLTHDCWLIVKGRLFGAHLISQKPCECWLIYTRGWVLNLRV